MKLTENLVIRWATLEDVTLLTDLSHMTILEKYPDVIGSDKVEGYVASGAVRKFYTERNEYCRVAELDGEVVGVSATRDNTIDLMMVAVAQHRGGIGSALLADAETHLFLDNEKLKLDSFRDNAQANTFYAKHGWKLDHYFDDIESGIPMVRLFKPRQ